MAKYRRTASFTHLAISHYFAGIHLISILLQWPTTLTVFEFNAAGGGNGFSSTMDHSNFASALLAHKETLYTCYNYTGLSPRNGLCLQRRTLSETRIFTSIFVVYRS